MRVLSLCALVALLFATSVAAQQVEKLDEGLHYASLHTNRREWQETVNTPDNG